MIHTYVHINLILSWLTPNNIKLLNKKAILNRRYDLGRQPLYLLKGHLLLYSFCVNQNESVLKGDVLHLRPNNKNNDIKRSVYPNHPLQLFPSTSSYSSFNFNYLGETVFIFLYERDEVRESVCCLPNVETDPDAQLES